MFNPLLQDFSNVKDQELENQLSELNRKQGIAYRMGNSALAMQVTIVIEAIRSEMARRQAEATKKLMEKQSKNLDGLINVD